MMSLSLACVRTYSSEKSRARACAAKPLASVNSQRRHVRVHSVLPPSERNGWWLTKPQPNFLQADNFEEIVHILQQHPDRLVLLDFYAPWCHACKSLYPKLSKLCEQNPQIVVAKVDFEANRELAKKLGVKVLPFFQAYHGSMGRVAAFSSSVTKIQRLKDCIEIFGQPYCDIMSYKGEVDIAQSLPEFQTLPVPSDATVLKFNDEGDYDRERTMAGRDVQMAGAA